MMRVTYILKHRTKQLFYCGVTENLKRRMHEHSKDRWKNYVLLYVFNGNYEKEVKRAGVRTITDLIRNLHQK